MAIFYVEFHFSCLLLSISDLGEVEDEIFRSIFYVEFHFSCLLLSISDLGEVEDEIFRRRRDNEVSRTLYKCCPKCRVTYRMSPAGMVLSHTESQ
jgi:hypothetical protein